MAFQVGEKVVYPNQGVGIIEQISTRNLTGQPEMFYLLKLNSSSLRVMVPISNVENVGLRKVVRGKEVDTILEFLRKGNAKPNRIGSDALRRTPRRCEAVRCSRS